MPFSRTWKVLEREVFKMAMEKFWIFFWENSKISKNGYCSVSYQILYMLCLLILLFII